MKRIINYLLLAGAVLLSSLANAGTGRLFKISESGNPTAVDVILCLNGKGHLSCQNYHVSAEDLQINTTASHHYPAAGIKVLTPGYQALGCTPYSNSYCLFATSNTTSAAIHLNPRVKKKDHTITFVSTPPSSPAVGDTYNVAATASSGLTVTITVDPSSRGACSVSGSTVTFHTGGICIVNADHPGNAVYNPAPRVQQTIAVVASFPAANSPRNVLAVPGNGQAVISWSMPSDIGPGAITAYTVTYGPTSGTNFTTAGCTTTSFTCTVTGLTNGTAYTFAVVTTTELNGLSQTGLSSLSSSITPANGLVVSPSTLALAAKGAARYTTLTNTTGSAITLNTTPAKGNFNPALPTEAVLVTTCDASTPIPPGGSCTIFIDPGAMASTNNVGASCTGGYVPEYSTLSIGYNSGSSINVNVVVLGYACIYQGGYLFSIDDWTDNSGSIGGKVVATTQQSVGINWSNAVNDSIWGIDDASTVTIPSPNGFSTQPTTFMAGQLNCDAVNDGACATHNIELFYSSSPLTSYAAGLCREPLTGDNSSTVCTGGANCYTDWYLPSTCDLGSSMKTVQSCITGSGNITQQVVLGSSNTNIGGVNWSSTEDSTNPQFSAWSQTFVPANEIQTSFGKQNTFGVFCVRNLTF